jgi:RAB protein geranylgeranyltransferase component A
MQVMKVPANETEALATGLMGFFEKRRFKDYLFFCTDYDPNKPKTHGSMRQLALSLSLFICLFLSFFFQFEFKQL